jgi:pimeloyl-ACP methyl ester carboxylesterase
VNPDLNIEKVEGKGTPIVFIHGWMGSKEVWSQVKKNLDLENPLILYDQRCHGNSECSEFSIEDLTKDLEKITEEAEKPVLVGHSMGGMTALKYSKMSENLSGMLLLATSASTPETEYRSPEFLLNQISDAAKEKITEILADKNRKDGENRENILTDIGLKEILEVDRKPLLHGLKAMMEYDVRKELEKETALVVAGEKDKVIPPEQSEKLSEILNCEFRMTDTSHLMLQENPEKIAEITENFVEKL